MSVIDPSQKQQIKLMAAAAFGAAEALTGAGAVSPNITTTRLTSSGVGQAITLADGASKGQRKRIIHAVRGGGTGTMVLTPVHLSESLSTVTFTNVRDWVELEWNGSAWDVVAYAGCTFA